MPLSHLSLVRQYDRPLGGIGLRSETSRGDTRPIAGNHKSKGVRVPGYDDIGVAQKRPHFEFLYSLALSKMCVVRLDGTKSCQALPLAYAYFITSSMIPVSTVRQHEQWSTAPFLDCVRKVVARPILPALSCRVM
jgi:hypothetical protein